MFCLLKILFKQRYTVLGIKHCSAYFSRGTHNATAKENKLLSYLRAKIEATGPISVADYMKEALAIPVTGYYMNRDVFGRSGDFITSPEVSQIFGELIGVWFYNEWQKVGRPKPLQLVEFGPGRGTLADDILRTFSKVGTSGMDFSIHLIEISPYLCHMQKSKLCYEENKYEDLYSKTFQTKYGFPVTWHPHLHTVPDSFSFFLAHEFLDVLPVHKFQPSEKHDHVEISPEIGILLNDVCKRMKEDGGITLIVDYGHYGEKTDTFRSFKNHKLHDPLEDPGEADLTVDVDFSYISKVAENKAVVIGPVTQRNFLSKMGIEIRLEQLMQGASVENQNSLKSGCDMLINPEQMGERFKFLALYPLVLKDFLSRYPPPGF
ncbi:protein arginine methyltransferase NDUFAF7 homolog, mitochondrial-like isoform X2 [Stegodyphus dumicola]|uniref:protein arginine methyltransferase NDUFAF7 homolog, mitochondrial-like isoform X2 n=1 Tax=Stegodyphus dumicola TaxID=202533 RepID=UPI0015A988EE|nr:protein arginine methyltransferase NDUFAF7 homolog, mitochondrial-like isoform X2 [Stegodyphus dumicola]